MLITKPDKRAWNFILNHLDYTTRMNVMLSDKTKSNHSTDESDHIAQRKKPKSLDFKKVGDTLKSTGSQISRLHGFPKIPKPEQSIR